MRMSPPFHNRNPGLLQRSWGWKGGARALLGLALMLPLAACATKRDVRDLGEEIRTLNARQAELIREVQRDQRDLRDSVRVVSSTQTNMRAEILRRIVDLQEDLLRLQEVTGISQQQLAALRDQLERERRSVPTGSIGMDEGGGGSAADEIYDASVTQFRRGAYTSARLGFEEILERFPNHALAPDARYYLADIQVQESDPQGAIQGFLRVHEFHPTSDRAPDALYRVGMLYRETGDRDEARRYLERVVNTWPDSGAADLARDALRSM
jgi:tol-pal system protein YbgF